MEIITHSAQETERLAQKTIWGCWDVVSKKCLFFALAGDLGVGKTVFAKGIGRFLGIKVPVRSPGYLVIREYSYSRREQGSRRRRGSYFRPASSTPAGETPGVSGDLTPGVKEAGVSPAGKEAGEESAGKLFHIDLWRIEDETEARALGIEEMIKPGNVILLEWAQKIPTFLDELRQRSDLKMISISFEHKGEKEREVGISD